MENVIRVQIVQLQVDQSFVESLFFQKANENMDASTFSKVILIARSQKDLASRISSYIWNYGARGAYPILLSDLVSLPMG